MAKLVRKKEVRMSIRLTATAMALLVVIVVLLNKSIGVGAEPQRVAAAQATVVRDSTSGGKDIRNAAEFPGASVVERIQAAIRDCGPNPCNVYVPAGSYNASSISNWKARDFTGAYVGIAIPSNVEIGGAGKGHTVIHVTRSTGDPPATLLANAEGPSRNIRLHDMTINWVDADSKFDWVSIFICHGCNQVELDHLSLEGNPNKLVNLLDCTGSSVHDNSFVLHSTGYGHGDNALSLSRFNSAIAAGREAGVVRDNHFSQTGDYRTFSMLIVAQSGLYVHGNVFEAHLPPPGNATGIESGQDNLARLPENVKISGNMFHGASIAYGGLSNSEISGNFLDHGDIYVALQDGTTASLAGLTIADNELHFGSIAMGGLEHVFTGRSLITRNRVFDGGIGTGNSLVARNIEVSYNIVRYTRERTGIECNACSVVRGNLVREVDQGGPADRHAGYVIGGSAVDVSDNIYIDEQHEHTLAQFVAWPSRQQKRVCHQEKVVGCCCAAVSGVLAGPIARYSPSAAVYLFALSSTARCWSWTTTRCRARRHALPPASNYVQRF